MTAQSLKELAYVNLVQIYQTRSDLLSTVSAIVSPHASAIAESFYDEMLSVEESRAFLDSSLVKERLRSSMSTWIRALFEPRTRGEIESYIDRQTLIGEVHARINIPLHLVNVGMQILKRGIAQVLFDAPLPEREKLEALMVSGELLDNAIAVINEVYLLQLTENERASESLRIHVSGAYLTAECERLKASLLDWLRIFLVAIVEGKPASAVSNFKQSDFGLWVAYRADVFFPDNKEVIELKKLTEKNHEAVVQLVACDWQHGSAECQAGLAEINQNVTSAVWLLTKLAEDNMQFEHGRDSLTQLFGRRHVPSVIQRQIEINRSSQASFSLLMLDVDHFKGINDKFGHKIGDAVLRKLATLIADSIRASDFVFRYGGEEFLIVLGNTQLSQAEKIAEELCQTIASQSFAVDGYETGATVSIGVAAYFGHPDYHQLIDKADTAMFAAKEAGRNCWRSASVPSA